MTTKFLDSIIMLRFGKTEVAEKRILCCKKINKNLGCWC